MRRLTRSFAAVLSMALLSTPLHADVARPRKAAAPAETVKTRLKELGVRTEKAEAGAKALTGTEAKFFAQSPDRIQVVGARQDFFSGQSVNLWYESVAGLGMLAVGVGTLYFMTHNRE